ncbi:MAG TPA: BON domain-containing protein [Bryobacteraceae bacterium]|nr:BON domain-containing protein [Bryobacteraceae bacterium]
MRSLEEIPDNVLCEHIVHALKRQPDIASSDINVAVEGGVATLTGFVHSYYAKLSAEDAVKHVPGIEGLANDIQVKLGSQASDPEIARRAVHALREQPGFSGITVTVRDGLLTLEGSVESYREKRAAEDAIMAVPGARGLISRLEIRAA